MSSRAYLRTGYKRISLVRRGVVEGAGEGVCASAV